MAVWGTISSKTIDPLTNTCNCDHKDNVWMHKENKCSVVSNEVLQNEQRGEEEIPNLNNFSFKYRISFKIFYWKILVRV